MGVFQVRASVLAGALLLLLGPSAAQAWKTLSAAQAADHAGEQARVCGEVASSKYSRKSDGEPTFLNLDEPFPDHVFTALVWGEDRHKFKPPPDALRGRRICVDGVIARYKGRPQIIVTEPAQITAAP